MNPDEFRLSGSANAGDDILVFRTDGSETFFADYFGSCYAEFELKINTGMSWPTHNGDDGTALFENYTFMHHNQIDKIRDLLNGNAIGLIRLIKASFEFPKRAENDFRYSHSLGGGALLDCGGYTVKLASSLLGESTYVADAFLVSEEREVDLFGNVVLRNASGLTAQLSFGMDNDYRCDLEICGSEGTIEASRIFTAPDAFEACVSVFSNGKTIKEYLMADDQFLRSIEKFCDCVKSKKRFFFNALVIHIFSILVISSYKSLY